MNNPLQAYWQEHFLSPGMEIKNFDRTFRVKNNHVIHKHHSMENQSSQNQVTRAGVHLFRYQLVYDIFFLLMVIAGGVLTYLEKPGTLLILAGLAFSAVLSLLAAFAPLPETTAKGTDRFLYRFNAILVVLILAGIIFTVYHLPLARTLLIIGTVGILIAVLAMLIRKTRLPGQKVIRFGTIIKSLIIGISGVIIYIIDVTSP
ncbi:MAG TPA: hypothetical protein ENK25_04840 [Bacteroidetes bacterium]|nr:hypothetical protein [Bacteroidota bacterium]